MAFPHDYLHPNEALVLDLKPHWFRLVPPGAALAGTLVLGVVVWANTDNQALSIGVGLLILAALGWFGSSYASWTSTHFVVTSDRLIHREGIVRRAGIEIPLDRINTVHSSQNLFERMIGAGDLTIESASAEGRSEFHDIRRPTQVQNEIYVAKDQAEERRFQRMAQTASPGAPPAGASIPEQIDQLDALRQRGVISHEEFERKKAELLGRM